jgi:RimJ/RimL family protein N-acetyltransferase
MQPDDLAAFMTYRNDHDANRFDGAGDITEARARAFIADQSTLLLAEPGVWLQIAVELPGHGLIGDCGFCVQNDAPHTAEIGYRLSRRYWHRGYASEAVSGLVGWAFNTIRLHRIIALIDTRNHNSIALVERLGFRREGHFLQSYREPDGWSDEYLYAMLSTDWHTGSQETY